MSGRETYDVPAKTRNILEWKAARRTKLRHEYLEQWGNPYRRMTGAGGTMFDTGLTRLQAMRARAHEHFRPNVKSGLWNLGFTVLPIILAMYIIIGSKDADELALREGKVSYRDRKFKFQ